MKTGTLIVALLFSSILFSQEVTETKSEKKGSEIGFHLSQFQKDFGFGLDYTSPFLVKNQYLAFTLRANVMYLEHIKDLTTTTWTPYFNAQLGVIGSKARISKNISIYGEGGLMIVIPDSEFSTTDVHFGGYGLFGFQFNFDRQNAYFIELGGVGIDATADKIPLEPIYSNGFLINVGYKVIF